MMSRFCSRPSTWYLPAAARSNRTTVPARIRLASARGVSRKRHFPGSFPSSGPDGPASRKAAFSGQPQNQIKNAKTGSALCRPRFGWYRKIREWLCIPALGNTAQFAPFGLSTAASALRIMRYCPYTILRDLWTPVFKNSTHSAMFTAWSPRRSRYLSIINKSSAVPASSGWAAM